MELRKGKQPMKIKYSTNTQNRSFNGDKNKNWQEKVSSNANKKCFFWSLSHPEDVINLQIQTQNKSFDWASTQTQIQRLCPCRQTERSKKWKERCSISKINQDQVQTNRSIQELVKNLFPTNWNRNWAMVEVKT